MLLFISDKFIILPAYYIGVLWMKNIIFISVFVTGFMFGSTYSTTEASKK